MPCHRGHRGQTLPCCPLPPGTAVSPPLLPPPREATGHRTRVPHHPHGHGTWWQPQCSKEPLGGGKGQPPAAAGRERAGGRCSPAACTGRRFGSDAPARAAAPSPALPAPACSTGRASAGTVGTGQDRGLLQGAGGLAGKVVAGEGGMGRCVVLTGGTWALAGDEESGGFPGKEEGKRVWERGGSQGEGGIQTLPVGGMGWGLGGEMRCWGCGMAPPPHS